jgi:hypothetical protein
MIPFSLPFTLVAAGVPIWIVGALLESRSAQREGRELKESKAAAMLYTLACIGAWGVYFYVSLLSIRNQRAVDGVWTEITQTSLAGDPVLNFLMWATIVVVAAALIPGLIGVGLYLIGIALGLAFFLALVVQPLIALAKVSPIGALVTAILVAVPPILLFRKYRSNLATAAWRVFGPVYGLFFDWWLTPLLRGRKVRRNMDQLHRKRNQCEALVLRLQAEYPEAAGDMGLSAGSDTWLERMIERFHDRDRQKNIAERTKLISLATQYFTEYRAMLTAHHELSRVGRDATIRDLQRDKEEKTLRNDIADIDELRAIDRETQRLAKEHERDEFKRKLAGLGDGPYKQGMKDKKARRMIDIEDHLFEALEHPIQTEVDARVLYEKLRQKIDRHPELGDDDKDQLQERLKQRVGQLFKTSSSSRIFEED